jgi:hypothetical protein
VSPSGDDRGRTSLPDFVGLGALKAGTSYLDALLRSHPGLSLPLHLKEVEYFTAHHDRGPDWYAAQFAPADGRPRGEISPQYLFDEHGPERIAAANPDARLIVSVRHPVTRAFSQYRHWVQESGYRGDFATYLAEHPAAVGRSRYWTLLERYRALFPDDRIAVVVFEDLVAQPVTTISEVYRFLGVDPDHVPAAAGTPVNASGTPRFPRLYVQSKRVSRWLYARGAGRAVERVKAAGVGRALRGSSTGGLPIGPPVDVATRLARELRPEAAALSGHLGRDLVELWQL